MPLLLTFRTIVAAPAGDNHAPDRRFTNQARFGFPAIDSVLQLKKTLFAVSVNIVRNRGAAQGNRLPQHLLDGQVKSSQILAGK
jgi:hypothetical protein